MEENTQAVERGKQASLFAAQQLSRLQEEKEQREQNEKMEKQKPEREAHQNEKKAKQEMYNHEEVQNENQENETMQEKEQKANIQEANKKVLQAQKAFRLQQEKAAGVAVRASCQAIAKAKAFKTPRVEYCLFYYLVSPNVGANVFKTRRGQLFLKQVGPGPDLYFRLSCIARI